MVEPLLSREILPQKIQRARIESNTGKDQFIEICTLNGKDTKVRKCYGTIKSGHLGTLKPNIRKLRLKVKLSNFLIVF